MKWQLAQKELKDWYQTPYGVYVKRWFDDALAPLVGNFFGATAAQYGVVPDSFLVHNRIPSKLGINTYNSIELPWFETEEAFWSVMPNGLDLIVMPHALEYADDPYALMRVAVDSLNHEGLIVFLMLNPHTPWRARQQTDWVRRSFSAKSLFKDLRVLGLELVESRFGCYCPVFESEEKFRRYAWLDAAGDRWCGHFGGVYYLIAKKRVWSEKWVGRLQFSKPLSFLKPAVAKATLDQSIVGNKELMIDETN